MYILKQDFQYTTSTKQILLLKAGTKIDKKNGDHYVISKARKEYRIPKDIVETNPDFFEKQDLRSQLQDILKTNSKRTAPKTAEILEDFLVNQYLFEKELVEIDLIKDMLEACRLMYMETKEDKWLEPIHKLGWNVDAKGVFRE